MSSNCMNWFCISAALLAAGRVGVAALVVARVRGVRLVMGVCLAAGRER
jgi:hypothetical protein